MPVVTYQVPALRRIVGKALSAREMGDALPRIGGELSGIEGDALTMEWFPNRPDLLCVEGAGRALRALLGLSPGMAKYPVAPATTRLEVDASVAQVRPHAALCFVRNVPFDAELVQSALDAQEKLAQGPGRRRKRVAIGIHDAAGLKGPFRYVAVGPDERPFVPLGSTRAMTPAQIVAEHPKGQEYGHLLAAGRFPLFLDGAGQVLSLPPLINAQGTAVTEHTRDVLIDVTGTDARAVRQTAALLATAFAERGGAIEAVEVRDAAGTWHCPDLKPAEAVVHTDDAAALLGVALDADQAAQALRRMGHDADAYGNKVHVRSPPWRFDLFHAVDLHEDIAIGHGFAQFPDDLPRSATFGGRRARHAAESRVRGVLAGHGWLEVRTLTLSDAASQWGRWGEPAGEAVRVRNPALAEQSLLRRRLLPGLLHVLAANRHRNYPQRIFEVGYVVEKDAQGAWRNRLRVAGALADAKAGFSDAKALVESLLRDARLAARAEPGHAAGLVAGRQGRLRAAGGGEAGLFGELHPDTLLAFGLGVPVAAFEVNLDLVAPEGGAT